MSDDIVKALLESLTPDQKEDLIKGILNSNVKGGETPKTKDVEETVSSSPRPNVNKDFSVDRENVKGSKKLVKFRKNKWVDQGEMRDETVNYDKLEKTRTPRERGQPNKRQVECHVCGKSFAMNENLIHGEYIRCNRCTGR
jgi:DNA-directed RNA polymerase subunit RPC12/RpoP